MSSQTSKTMWITGIIGVILLGFGIIWGTVIFERFEVVPDDLNREVYLDGTYTLVDTSFTTRLLANETVAGIAASGSGGDLLSDPAIGGLLANPALGDLVSNPDILGLLADPAALAPLADPAVIGALSDPAVMAAVANPTLIPTLIAANPAVGGLLADPAVSGLLASGAVSALLTNPDLVALVTDPALGAVLANPVVSSLLADPDALALVLDPRTQQILVNPANLPTVDIPVSLHRTRVADHADGDVLYMTEILTTTNLLDNSDMGLLDPRFGPSETTLVVDRSTKEYVTELMNEGAKRSGQWGLPFHTNKDTVYPSWISFAGQPLDAEYGETTSTNGLQIYTYIVDAENVQLGGNDPAGTGLPLVFDTHTVAFVEPITGAGVDATLQDTVSVMAPDGSKYVRIANDLEYRDDSVAELVDETDGLKNDIVWFGSWLPVGAAIVGGILLLMAIGLFLKVRMDAERA
ncbi:MAG TPA: porin PorA family protein [Dehalococcoidia bacterium]|nr:porin PorA family protein [Dehalococcoidia bacterium]MDP6274503.1 porin PorA family protein [Dehalococcoidia bacterium]MDP7161381.1 porin PorA family protein [Dehalococcoidia bacterium]MDP7514936.1 porin PorA family protein [Dehalococcoidia bacterium]HJM53059.1 porin PorA family protein [Dehalococcoidia bacterium]